MSRTQDLTGQVLRGQVVLSRAPNEKIGTSSRAMWLVRCACGNTHTVRAGRLHQPGVMKCMVCRKISHGHTRNGSSGAYRSWRAMWQRCRGTKSNSERYHNRVKACARWKNFENFLADMGDRPEGKTLERVNNDRGYSPSNCCWATHCEQMKNTCRNVYRSMDGKRMCLADWARLYGIRYGRLRNAIQVRGLSLRKAVEGCS